MESYTNNIYKTGFDANLSKPLSGTSISPANALDGVYNDGFNSDLKIEDLALSGQKVGGTIQVGGAGAGAGTFDVLDASGNPVLIEDQNGAHFIGTTSIDFNAKDPTALPGSAFPYLKLASLQMVPNPGGLTIKGELGIPLTIFGGAGIIIGTQSADMVFQQPGTGPGGFNRFVFQSDSPGTVPLFVIDAATGNLGSNTVSASGAATPAQVNNKFPIMDTNGNLIGFVPVYNAL
jgi:hypothetical protein